MMQYSEIEFEGLSVGYVEGGNTAFWCLVSIRVPCFSKSSWRGGLVKFDDESVQAKHQEEVRTAPSIPSIDNQEFWAHGNLEMIIQLNAVAKGPLDDDGVGVHRCENSAAEEIEPDLLESRGDSKGCREGFLR